MNLRRVLSAAAGGFGLLATANSAISARASELDPPLPGDQRTYRWRGFDVSYTEAGDPDDHDLLLLHGLNAAASSHEFEPIFEHLADSYHVVAPDLPGFGRSDRPPLTYSGSLYTDFVQEFAAENTEDAVCVASSLAGAYAALAARDDPDLFSKLVLISPTATTIPGRRVWVRSLWRAPVVGQTLHNLVVSKPGLRYFSADHGYYDVENYTDERAAYDWQTAHQPGARYATASFVGGFLDLDVDLEEVLADVSVPVTLVWGRNAETTPVERGRELANAADTRLIVFEEALLLPHVEYPDQFAAVVAGEYEKTEQQ
jgi:pimeloyl-ACP methyl ester carboxylesterase